MPDKEKEIAGIPIGGVFVILALLLGYFAIPDQPFKTSRQSIPDAAQIQAPKSSHVEARLWEDPFAAVMRSKGYAVSGAEEYRLPRLAGRLAEKILNAPDRELVVLGVTVFGGEYAESSEMRRRGRYAVLSALAEQGYYPDLPDQLDYVDFRDPEADEIRVKPLAIMPYEGFSWDPSLPRKASAAPNVFVLWLNEDHLYPKPLMKLGSLVSGIKAAVDREREERFFPDKIKFKFLGPAGSTTLKAMIDENAVSGTDEKHHASLTLHNVEMFCWGATADESFLLEGRSTSDLENVIRQEFPLRFYRTIGTDRQLMDALVGELKRRGVEPSSDHIALISEWDTIYGRTLPKMFALGAGLPVDSRNIHRFSYMRGIDGQVLKAGEAAKASASPAQGGPKGGRPEDIEKPVGSSQFDYLRRLARNLKETDWDLRETSGGIKAIGVLGSDIYDKLLVLQASYELFPGAIFFTTDLDARFLHPDERRWTGNLVIASSFGLNLHPELQKNVPPFRDSYQTALFFAARLALASAAAGDVKDCIADALASPRIFEIGRTDAVDLSLPPESGSAPAYPCDWLDSRSSSKMGPVPSIHPEPRTGRLPISLLRALWMGAALVFFLAMIRFCGRSWHIGEGTALRLLIAIGGAVGLVTVGALLLGVVRWQADGGEPLGLLEGVSLWPTVYLRLVAFVLAVGLIVTVCRRSRKLEQELQDYFGGAESTERAPDRAAPHAGEAPPAWPEGLWEGFCRRSTPIERAKRVVCLAVPYGLLCAAIILAFGAPFVPFRGATSKFAHYVSLVMSIGAFIVLLFWVVDATSMAVWLIKQVQEDFSGWSENVKRPAAKRFGVDAKDVNDWIGLEFIVKLTDTDNKFIYYPILVIILSWVSRLSYFDRWDMPPGLLIVILLGLGFSLSCAVRLRRKAEQFRKEALARMWEKQVRLAGEADGAKGLARKLDLMAGQMNSIRSGAFVPFLEQPWVRASLIFLTSGGGITALQYLPWFQ